MMQRGFETIKLSAIQRDEGIQCRTCTNDETVSEYVAEMQAGAEFPPVTVFRNEETDEIVLADGFHRLAAMEQVLGKDARVRAVVRRGDRRAALLYSLRCNALHGLRRSNADKRKAVETTLRDKEWGQLPNTKIAEMCAVNEKTVRTIRAELELSSEIPKIETRTVERNGTTYIQKASREKRCPHCGTTEQPGGVWGPNQHCWGCHVDLNPTWNPLAWLERHDWKYEGAIGTVGYIATRSGTENNNHYSVTIDQMEKEYLARCGHDFDKTRPWVGLPSGTQFEWQGGRVRVWWGTHEARGRDPVEAITTLKQQLDGIGSTPAAPPPGQEKPRECKNCGTTEGREWYGREGSWLCQKCYMAQAAAAPAQKQCSRCGSGIETGEYCNDCHMWINNPSEKPASFITSVGWIWRRAAEDFIARSPNRGDGCEYRAEIRSRSLPDLAVGVKVFLQGRYWDGCPLETEFEYGSDGLVRIRHFKKNIRTDLHSDIIHALRQFKWMLAENGSRDAAEGTLAEGPPAESCGWMLEENGSEGNAAAAPAVGAAASSPHDAAPQFYQATIVGEIRVEGRVWAADRNSSLDILEQEMRRIMEGRTTKRLQCRLRFYIRHADEVHEKEEDEEEKAA